MKESLMNLKRKNQMVNILITGSRNITDRTLIFSKLQQEIKEGDVIIHGGANGVDSIANDFCNDNNISVVIVRPINSIPISYLHRNAEMIGMCDRVIAFWDGKSRGTDFTIKYAKIRNMDVKIFKGKSF